MSYPNPDNENNLAQEKEAQLNAQKEILLKQFLSPDARLRLNNVRMVKPDLANLVENYILNLASQGKFSGQISDEQLKQILSSTQQVKSKITFQNVSIDLNKTYNR
jgi:programmed cell death protein 5